TAVRGPEARRPAGVLVQGSEGVLAETHSGRRGSDARLRFVDGDELERCLRELGVATAPLLDGQQQRDYEDFLWASEYGLALECLSDWLAEDEMPIRPAVRDEMRRL